MVSRKDDTVGANELFVGISDGRLVSGLIGPSDGLLVGTDDGSLFGCSEDCVLFGVNCVTPVGARLTLVGLPEGWKDDIIGTHEIFVSITLGVTVGMLVGLADSVYVGFPVFVSNVGVGGFILGEVESIAVFVGLLEVISVGCFDGITE